MTLSVGAKTKVRKGSRGTARQGAVIKLLSKTALAVSESTGHRFRSAVPRAQLSAAPIASAVIAQGSRRTLPRSGTGKMGGDLKLQSHCMGS